MSTSSYKVSIRLEVRPDGGLRAWSPDVPELVLSHADPRLVLADVPRALEVILSERLGGSVTVEELRPLPTSSTAIAETEREYAARAA